MKRKKVIKEDKILTVIGKETMIAGTLKGNSPVRIDGGVEGEVHIDSDIIIGEGAVIQANVKGHNIQVAGRVVGNIEASGKLEMLTTGVVEGDVSVHTLHVADGAMLTGNCSMQRAPERKEVQKKANT
ncbi:bactofilin family protein [Dethiobacter alkaliphilus]|uniref:Integral membrane protein CcmA involved in cell shape determination n=1 Tax=Dethiobacter alkaliphilus AHT 1 TaxID=555088 RepID=C0GKA0_DETAL|nr:polymer-forming cytoskeletal protein [Dethiobacter alkaliphilus]EEG76215.1 protein of unknown function DUF583 [Dethiobacter alkaliphilus AHT 1]